MLHGDLNSILFYDSMAVWHSFSIFLVRFMPPSENPPLRVSRSLLPVFRCGVKHIQIGTRKGDGLRLNFIERNKWVVVVVQLLCSFLKKVLFKVNPSVTRQLSSSIYGHLRK